MFIRCTVQLSLCQMFSCLVSVRPSDRRINVSRLSVRPPSLLEPSSYTVCFVCVGSHINYQLKVIINDHRTVYIIILSLVCIPFIDQHLTVSSQQGNAQGYELNLSSLFTLKKWDILRLTVTEVITNILLYIDENIYLKDRSRFSPFGLGIPIQPTPALVCVIKDMNVLYTVYHRLTVCLLLNADGQFRH